MVLVKAPLTEGVVFPGSAARSLWQRRFFETLPAAAPRSRAKTAGFFSDFSDLKPGDFVVHVDHGIGQFEGLRQVELRARQANSCSCATRVTRNYTSRLRGSTSSRNINRSVASSRRSTAWAQQSGKHARRACANPSATWRKNFSPSTPTAKLRPATPFRRYEFAARIRGCIRIPGNPRPAARHRRR